MNDCIRHKGLCILFRKVNICLLPCSTLTIDQVGPLSFSWALTRLTVAPLALKYPLGSLNYRDSQ